MAIGPLITVQILTTKKDGKAVLLLFCVVLEEYVLQHEENREDVHNGGDFAPLLAGEVDNDVENDTDTDTRGDFDFDRGVVLFEQKQLFQYYLLPIYVLFM